MVRRETMRAHAETVAAFGVHVQFCRFLRGEPAVIEADGNWREAEVIVGRRGDKHGRRIRGDDRIFEQFPAGIDGCYEGWPSFRRILQSHACGYCAAR